MPDEPDANSGPARAQSFKWDDVPSSSAAVLTPDDTASASTSGRQSTTANSGAQAQGPPAWWDPPPTIHVDQRYKQQVRFCATKQMTKQCLA